MARCGCPCHQGSKIPGFAESPNVTDWFAALTACDLCAILHASAHLTYGTRQQFRAGPPTPGFTNDDTLDDGG